MTARILVIDEAAELLNSFRAILEGEGYEVSLALSTNIKLADIELLQPDLIILDYPHPFMREKPSLLSQIKAYQPVATIPLLLCSAAYKEVAMLRPYLQEHRIPCLLKPFELDDLLRNVQMLLLSFTPEPTW